MAGIIMLGITLKSWSKCLTRSTDSTIAEREKIEIRPGLNTQPHRYGHSVEIVLLVFLWALMYMFPLASGGHVNLVVFSHWIFLVQSLFKVGLDADTLQRCLISAQAVPVSISLGVGRGDDGVAVSRPQLVVREGLQSHQVVVQSIEVAVLVSDEISIALIVSGTRATS